MASRYASEAWGHADELLDLLSEDDRDALRELLGRGRPFQVRQLVQANRALAIQVLRATPSKRQTLLRKLNADDRQVLLYCALVWGVRAARLLDSLDRHLPLALSGPYREATGAAAEAAADSADDERTLWPLPGLGPDWGTGDDLS